MNFWMYRGLRNPGSYNKSQKKIFSPKEKIQDLKNGAVSIALGTYILLTKNFWNYMNAVI